jgi:hypothetical protein
MRKWPGQTENWPPLGWQSDATPLNSIEGALQWLRAMQSSLRGLHALRVRKGKSSNPVLPRIVDDAHLLGQHLQSVHDWKDLPEHPGIACTALQASGYLRKIEEWVELSVEKAATTGTKPAVPGRPHETPIIPPVLIPTSLQTQILNELRGKALKLEPLADVLRVETSRLYRPGGLEELREAGLVAHQNGVGFYLPGAPPTTAIAAKSSKKRPMKRSRKK